ncbi:hypothetical protein MIV096R [Invertebrate iridescent virus 3]|uniref:Putative FAD-linked sulfhydryl oxidase 096R n=1 Tax=Invertebrate iridescent virus 3 TaxID=345201 RepID=VF347_IIV3|nr:hypothetical protein MIV096R [Invertebrate iridescent virus 3]Q196W4.1 RecName: Full=Putative FAD-linked sulfhydryl oxidase 096R [Invertebrate iridescent virus 3]ABF82126.1 hypothetical protein MIV096R [Invertebrate iridescent virus 3]
MSIDPKLWGNAFWSTLHHVAAGYNDHPSLGARQVMTNFIQSIPVLLPCAECQDHAFDYIGRADLDRVVSSRRQLFLFFFNFHNHVNARLNKPQLAAKTVFQRYRVPFDGEAAAATTEPPFHWSPWLTTALAVILVVVVAGIGHRSRFK